MLTPATAASAAQSSVQQELLPAERDFYSAYEWCLDPHLTIRETVDRLRDEIDRLEIVQEGWQTLEVATNVFLLSCAVLNDVDEYLRGPALAMPKRLSATAIGRSMRWTADSIAGVPADLRWRHRAQVRRWREQWQTGLDEFLAIVAAETSDAALFAEPGRKLANLLRRPLPLDLQAKRCRLPSAFRRFDLTHFDVLALGRRFAQRFPDRSQPILLLGLRTVGTYFVALLRAFLKAEGYQRVSSLTVQVNKGLGRRERRELRGYVERDYTCVIVDEPPSTGETLVLAFDLVRSAGVDLGKVAVLFPAHPAGQYRFKHLSDQAIVALEPEQWRKRQLLHPRNVERRLMEYFRKHHFARISVIDSSGVDALNVRLEDSSRRERGARLKRIFEVQLQTSGGLTETRYILAKSVGWGWLGYHAFLAGSRLSDFVPPILGLRDGILYMEWIPQDSPVEGDRLGRDAWIETAASYVAARVRSLNLSRTRVPPKSLRSYENGRRLLMRVLSKAYGRFGADLLMRSRLQQQMGRHPCPFPTLIDGNMSRAEWILGTYGLLKTDYEHHGMGKSELNVMDPACDLAGAILALALDPEEESRLVQRYVEESGDADVGQRLFMNKLLAGLWTMFSVQERLFDGPQTPDRQWELHRQFVNAWNFLTVHTARFCGSYCRSPQGPRWSSPLVALDIDGVLDRRLFGFPCTTAAGIEALSLLARHGFSVTLNTARSVAEVKDYCQAYGLAGGVAENGSYLWDAVAQHGRALISAEAKRQLDELKQRLLQLPGVFLDDRHQYSIRAFTYADKDSSLLPRLVKYLDSSNPWLPAPRPLSTLVMGHLMTSLRFDQLSFHRTTIDTTIVAKDIDKGTGLLALRDWVLGSEAETIAVGDSGADLPMFRVATRSFAPAHIDCANEARLAGCRISPYACQRGLSDIAREIVRSSGQRDTYAHNTATGSGPEHLFLELLRAADRTWFKNVTGALFDRIISRRFIR